MNKLFTSEKVYIHKSNILNAGRGVYAKRDIKKGEIIERCPVILVSKCDTSNLKESVLVTFFILVKRESNWQSHWVLGQYITTPMNQTQHTR